MYRSYSKEPNIRKNSPCDGRQMGEALSMKSCVSSGISVRRTLREKLRSIRLIFPTPPCLINQQSGQGEQEGSSFSLEFPFSLTSVGGVHSSESSDNPNLAWCPVRLLPLPNMLSARAQYSFGGHLFGQLLFANRARLRHYVCHKLASPRGKAACLNALHAADQKSCRFSRASCPTPVGLPNR